MTELRRVLESLRPSPQQEIIQPPKVIITAPASFGSQMPQASYPTGHSKFIYDYMLKMGKGLVKTIFIIWLFQQILT